MTCVDILGAGTNGKEIGQLLDRHKHVSHTPVKVPPSQNMLECLLWAHHPCQPPGSLLPRFHLCVFSALDMRCHSPDLSLHPPVFVLPHYPTKFTNLSTQNLSNFGGHFILPVLCMSPFEALISNASELVGWNELYIIQSWNTIANTRICLNNTIWISCHRHNYFCNFLSNE